MMNTLFKKDINQQAEAVRKTRQGLKETLDVHGLRNTYRRLIFTGSGDSYFASFALQYAARKYQDREVHVLLSNDAAHYWNFQVGDLVVPISISGESAKTIHTVRKALDAGASVLPISANADSTLMHDAENAALIPFQSVSRRTPHSSDYMTTLMAVASLVEALSGKCIACLDDVGNLVESVLEMLEGLDRKFSSVCGMQGVNIMGGGPNHGTAQYGAAKFWEANGSKASAFDIEEVGHGPFMSFRDQELAVILAMSGRSFSKAMAVLQGLDTLGFRTLVITDSGESIPAGQIVQIPTMDEVWSPFLACIPLQYLCLQYANHEKIDVSTAERFDQELHQKAFRFFREAEFSDLY